MNKRQLFRERVSCLRTYCIALGSPDARAVKLLYINIIIIMTVLMAFLSEKILQERKWGGEGGGVGGGGRRGGGKRQRIVIDI